MLGLIGPPALPPNPDECQGRWFHESTIHGNIHVFRCDGCWERHAIYRGQSVPIPRGITRPKKIVAIVRAFANYSEPRHYG